MPVAPPLATIASQTASLTVAVFDAASAAAWVQTKAAATKAQFTGTPAAVMHGLSKGEEVAEIDVGPSTGVAFELEGASGRLEIYRVDATAIALVAPPRAWWIEAGAQASDVDALFAAALSPDGLDDAEPHGELELASGRLAVVYIWHRKIGLARELAASLAPGGALTFGDGYGQGDGAAVVDVGPGSHQLRKRELEAPWDPTRSLVVMYLVAG